MRTTIRLDEALLRRAKAHAAAMGRSLNDFITDAIRAALAVRPGRFGGTRPALPTFRGKGLQAGIDLDDTAALLDRMEEPGPESGKRVAERPLRPRR